ncbi:MAG: hypothetical protein RIR51_899 [Bacteroidota bacterium]|jgi:pimeloyl-ACP methyl ester carboxylesterase
MKFNRLITLILIIQIVFYSCNPKSDDPKPDPNNEEIVFNPTEEGGLVSYEKITDVTASSIQGTVSLASVLGFELNTSVVKYPVDVYKIEYMMTYKGSLTKASGLLAVPNISTSLNIPAFSFQHGTILLKSEAPSLDLANTLLPLELYLPASLGMMAVVPDYIGFGSSSSIYHPYYVKEPAALSIVDLLKAAKNFVNQKYKNLTINQKAYLVGYSQGGYTTLAAHQYLTQNPAASTFTEFTSYAASGGYDLPLMQEIISKRTNYDQPYYLGYILKAYQTHYGISSPTWADVIKAPYNTQIEALMDGTKSGTEVNAALTTTVANLFTQNFLTNYSTDAVFANLRNKLNENSLNKVPSSRPLFLYHGTGDTWVFPETSKSTYDSLMTKGSTNISYIEVNGNHSSGFISFANDVFKKLVSSL